MMRAPWLVRQLLRRLAPPGESDALVGDLEDEAREVADYAGVRAARRWMRRQAVHSIWPLGRHRMRGFRRRAGEGVQMFARGWTTDIKHVLRRLSRTPGFAAVAVISLALGIGATSTIFSLAHAVWLKPLPYRDAQDLVLVHLQHQKSGAAASLSGPDIADYRAGMPGLSSFAVGGYGAQIARIAGERRRVVAHHVSSNLFDVLGTGPAIGRTFVPADAGAQVVVISHATWVSYFNRDPAILSRTFELSGRPYSIAGVMPQGFRYPQVLEGDLWIASTFASWTDRTQRHLEGVGRLASGVGMDRVNAEAKSVAANIASQHPATNADWTATVTPLDRRDAYGGTFGVLLGIVGLFLLVGCANLAGLLIARNLDRRGELAVCVSLGASRLRIGRQMALEAGLLALVGGALGVGIAGAAARLLATTLPTTIPGAADVELSLPVLLFACAVSLATALVCGVLPALSAERVSASEALTGARNSGPRSHRLQHLLVAVEVAAAMTLIVGATLMASAFTGLLNRDRGFNPNGVLALNVSLPFEQDRYLDAARRAAALEQIIARVTQLPGVTHAGATNGFPGSSLGILGGAQLRSEIPDSSRVVAAAIRSASPDYFNAMGVTLKSGRMFAATDTASAPRVAIVNETLARAMWPEGGALNRILTLPEEGESGALQAWTVVGVASDMRLGLRAPPDIFLPVAQRPAFWIDLVIRTTGDPAALAPVVRRSLRELDPELLLENSRSIDSIIANRIGLERAQSLFASVIAALAAAVAGVGLYALLSFAVAQRSREFAIRLALGSAPRALFAGILFRGLRLAALGTAIGAAATFALIRLLRSQVFGLDAAPLWAFLMGAAILLTIALLALLAPARRVLHAQPITAMRN